MCLWIAHDSVPEVHESGALLRVEPNTIVASHKNTIALHNHSVHYVRHGDPSA
jgi:hypothetical protein